MGLTTKMLTRKLSMYLKLILPALFTLFLMNNAYSAKSTGTGDIGGGNLIDGRPIESYIENPLARNPSSQMRKLLAYLKKSNESVYNLFTYSLNKKIWYFVPAELDKLTGEKIGVPSAVQQAALQGTREIWVDTRYFDRMNTLDQFKLFVHEALMSIKILNFSSDYENCLSRASSTPISCGDKSKKSNGPLQLTIQDYQEIRELTQILTQPSLNLSSEDLEDLFANNNFATPEYGFVEKWRRVVIEPEELSRGLKNSTLFGTIPNQLYLVKLNSNLERQLTFISEAAVQISMNNNNQLSFLIQSNEMSFQILSNPLKEMKIIATGDNLPSSTFSFLIENSISIVDRRVCSQIGDETFEARLEFSAAAKTIIKATIYRWRCLNKDENFWDQTAVYDILRKPKDIL